MINPNEIRLGNWVLDDEGSCSKIIGFKPYDYSVRCDEDEGCCILFDRLHKGEWTKGWVTENANLHPIPLTEEILLKCGFEKVRYEKYAHNELNKLRAYPHVMKDGFGIYIMGSYTLPNIKHLHELQNLFFALTGKELEIDEEKLKEALKDQIR